MTINTLIDEMMARQHLASRADRAGDGRRQHHHDPPLPGAGARSISGWNPIFRSRSTSLPLPAGRLGLHMHPEATVDCLPGVGAYVGGDITAGRAALRAWTEEEA